MALTERTQRPSTFGAVQTPQGRLQWEAAHVDRGFWTFRLTLDGMPHSGDYAECPSRRAAERLAREAVEHLRIDLKTVVDAN
tara:strand:+ start:1517 stop:1762 length:246 start_codon:yes stop_codon:yes gene_type:complete